MPAEESRWTPDWKRSESGLTLGGKDFGAELSSVGKKKVTCLVGPGPAADAFLTTCESDTDPGWRPGASKDGV